MTVKEINSVLEKHPYYGNLADEDKLNVLNLGLTKFWAKHTQKTVHAVIRSGLVGNDGVVIGIFGAEKCLNGTFYDATTGWETWGPYPSIFTVSDSVGYCSGGNILGDTSVTQTITTKIGTTYRFRAYYNATLSTPINGKISFGGTNFFVSGESSQYIEWTFVASSSTTTISIMTGYDETIAIQEVSVKEVLVGKEGHYSLVSTRKLSNGLSLYNTVDINLSNDEFLSGYTEDDRRLIYRMSVAKIAKLIPTMYATHNETTGITIGSHGEIGGKMLVPIVSYNYTKIKNVSAYFNKAIKSFSIPASSYGIAKLTIFASWELLRKKLTSKAYLSLSTSYTELLKKDNSAIFPGLSISSSLLESYLVSASLPELSTNYVIVGFPTQIPIEIATMPELSTSYTIS